ncbi:MAG: hypothetical protein J6O61_14480 [Butyrivibrio sp.]|uniref:hypothetical protein n=1 Tax=Butyrivibrio sp. TaxID=28121 RepID=UPI001AFCF13B|nr:hypothetical protein [Butyrivibrio sp.]MBO6242008.1 hypothetical protein [Butyrivibrio sp.]
MKNGFERITSENNLEDSKKKLKAFRSEIYSSLEKGSKKKNAFTINSDKKPLNDINDKREENRDNTRGR